MENPSSLTYGRITWGLSSLICKAQMIMRTLLCSGEDDMEWDVWLAWLLYILGTLGTDTHRRRSVNSSSSWSFHTYTYCSGESPSGYKFFIWFKRQELFILFMEGRTLTFCKRKKKKKSSFQRLLGSFAKLENPINPSGVDSAGCLPSIHFSPPPTSFLFPPALQNLDYTDSLPLPGHVL